MRAANAFKSTARKVRENALWKLVNMCEESQQFDENYNRFPSHMDSWLRTSYRPGRWCGEECEAEDGGD